MTHVLEAALLSGHQLAQPQSHTTPTTLLSLMPNTNLHFVFIHFYNIAHVDFAAGTSSGYHSVLHHGQDSPPKMLTCTNNGVNVYTDIISVAYWVQPGEATGQKKQIVQYCTINKNRATAVTENRLQYIDWY